MTNSITALTLAQLLTSEDATVYRNAMSILKVLRECDHSPDSTGRCIYCFKQGIHPDLCQTCGWSGDGTGCYNPYCPAKAIT